ncbi:MAG: LLM class flavin-dependent oxidoreductase [Deltaproteobacteria bacterium]|nr:LLM class flavin-dependent oxidoreductase [Deltaproteobacteria bacterium]
MSDPRVEFGVNVNNRVPVLNPEEYPPWSMVELAREAEALGFDAVWVGDNFLARSRYECLTTLAVIAGATRRVKLGTAVLVGPLRHTLWLALTWASLDQLSGGRTILNLAVGGGVSEASEREVTREYAACGVPYRQRGRYLEDQIVVLRRLWTEEAVEHRSEFHVLDGVSLHPRPLQRPAPPIWLANNPQMYGVASPVVERMMRRVGRLADGWMTNAARPEQIRTFLAAIRAQAREAGRDPEAITPAYQMTLNINADRARARQEAVDYINRYYFTEYQEIGESYWHADPFGTPEQCAACIRGFIDAGVRSFSLRFASPDQVGQLRRFTESVLPALR